MDAILQLTAGQIHIYIPRADSLRIRDSNQEKPLITLLPHTRGKQKARMYAVNSNPIKNGMKPAPTPETAKSTTGTVFSLRGGAEYVVPNTK